MKLTDASTEQYFKVTALPSSHDKATTLIDEGIFEGSTLRLIAKSHFGGPVAISLHGTMFSMPFELANELEVERVS